MQRCLSGDVDAYEALVERYGGRVYNLTLRITDDPDSSKKDSPFERLLHELGVKDITPTSKLSLSRSSLPENVQVVALDSRAR